MGQVMHSDQNRVLHRAILASLVVHGLLLLAFPERRESLKPTEPPPPLLARLIEPEAPPEPLPSPPPPPLAPLTPEPPLAQPAPEIKPKPRPKPKPQAKPQPKRKLPPVVKPLPPEEPPPPATVERQPPPQSPAAPPDPPTLAESSSPAAIEVEPRTSPEPPPAYSVDPRPGPRAEQSIDGALALYRQQLLNTARKYKHYPRVAIDNAWEGDVVVHVVVGADGTIASLTVKSGSGHSVLDRQALDMFRRATPLVEIPAALRGREFALEVRAIYNLKDQVSG
jgi:periplasmic protein TonB